MVSKSYEHLSNTLQIWIGLNTFRDHCLLKESRSRERQYFFEHVKVLWVKCLPPSFPVSLQHIPQGDISWINYLHRIHWDKRVTRRDSGLGKGPSFFLFPYGDCGTHHLSFLKKKGGDREQILKVLQVPFSAVLIWVAWR